MSGQLNELGFMGYVGERLASRLGGLSWPTLYVTLIVLYVVIHYLFVSQTSQVLALFGVFLDVGVRGGVPLALMSFGLLFASSYFSVITPQGGSQNIIFAASGYLTQRELYKLGFMVTLAFLAVYLLVGSPWVYFVMRWFKTWSRLSVYQNTFEVKLERLVNKRNCGHFRGSQTMQAARAHGSMQAKIPEQAARSLHY